MNHLRFSLFELLILDAFCARFMMPHKFPRNFRKLSFSFFRGRVESFHFSHLFSLSLSIYAASNQHEKLFFSLSRYFFHHFILFSAIFFHKTVLRLTNYFILFISTCFLTLEVFLFANLNINYPLYFLLAQKRTFQWIN